jgi:hypothetical protein
MLYLVGMVVVVAGVLGGELKLTGLGVGIVLFAALLDITL